MCRKRRHQAWRRLVPRRGTVAPLRSTTNGRTLEGENTSAELKVRVFVKESMRRKMATRRAEHAPLRNFHSSVNQSGHNGMAPTRVARNFSSVMQSDKSSKLTLTLTLHV